MMGGSTASPAVARTVSATTRVTTAAMLPRMAVAAEHLRGIAGAFRCDA